MTTKPHKYLGSWWTRPSVTKSLLPRATRRTNQKSNDNITEGKHYGGSFGSAKIHAYEAQLVTTCSNPAARTSLLQAS